MKLKEIIYGIGLKPRTREYSFQIETFNLPRDGQVQYARWQHPKEKKKQFSQKSVDAIREFVHEGDAAIDIGAHTGDSTLPIALAAGSKGTVFALEPNPYVFKVLLANSALNRKATNIFPLMFAATPEDGQFDFEYSDPGFCNGGSHQDIGRWRHAHFFKLRINGRNLIRYLQAEFSDEAKRVRYIKIDTEGFDRLVAASLTELIEKNRPYIKSEIFRHMPDDQRRAYYADLRGLGYKVHKVNSDEDYAGAELGAEDMMKWKHYDIFAVPEKG